MLCIPKQSKGQFYYGLQQTFGKNRVQYNEFDWSFFRFERFDVYFYKQSRDIAGQVAEITEKNLVEIENFLDAPVEDRIRIIVFNNLSDLKQSNINASTDEAFNTGGVTRIVDSKLFVYFDGNHNHLEQALREGLAEIVLNNLIYGGFGESFKNSALLSLPDWYLNGLISYIANPWSVEIDEHVRDGMMSGQYKRFNALTGDNAKYAGHSMWRYIANTYGEGVIHSIVYMAVINRNVDSGFQFILGSDLKSITNNWKSYYKSYYEEKTGSHEELNLPGTEVKRSKKEQVFSNQEVSPDGKYIAYVSNELGEYKVWLYNVEKDRRKRIEKGGFKIAQNTDYSYPLLAWHPTSKLLAIIIEKKGFLWLQYYDMDKKKLTEKPLYRFDKIVDFTYSKDGKKFLFSAVQGGQSDIFEFTILSSSIEQITNDEYDDLTPTYAENDRYIIFSSNRVDDTLRVKEDINAYPDYYDLFLYDRKSKKPEVLRRLTTTAYLSEKQPIEYEDDHIMYLSNNNGTQNLHLMKMDSAISYVDTTVHYRYVNTNYQISNNKRNVLSHYVSPQTNLSAQLYYLKGCYRLNIDTLPNASALINNSFDPQKPGLPEGRGGASDEKPKDANQPNFNVNSAYEEELKPRTTPEVSINDYQFDVDLSKKYKLKEKEETKPEAKEVELIEKPTEVLITATDTAEESFVLPKSRLYFLSFYQDEFVAQVNNSFTNPTYQRYTGGGALFFNAGFNGFFKLGVVDLFKNYKLTGGVRTDFRPVSGLSISPNTEYAVSITDDSKRIDKELTYFRRSQLELLGLFFIRSISNEVRFKANYPFNQVASLRGTLGYRTDRLMALSTDNSSLQADNFDEDYLTSRLEFVYDNTISRGLNLYNGTRYKLFVEYFENLTTSNSGMFNLGIDFRKYTKVHRSIIWANRFAAGTSLGQERMIYYLGAVDNEFSPRFNDAPELVPDPTINYQFQTLVTNMRGFIQNIRNGTSFAVINSELRVPLFKYLLNRPIKNDFVENFQVIGFGDLGTAWNGLHPYADENSINSEQVLIGSNDPNTASVVIDIDKQKQPIVGGYGFGLRSRLFGYFVRADWAWGVEDGQILDNVFYISLNLDF